MTWAQHATSEDHAVIKKGPVDIQFDAVAVALLTQAARYAFRMRLPPAEQREFDAHWMRFQVLRRRPGMRDVNVFIEDHIRNLVREADDALGHPGANATQWMNDRANELIAEVQRHFNGE